MNFINILNDMIHELEFYKVLQNKGQKLLSKHLEQNKFIEETLFANNNADENINLLLELIDPKTHVCIIDSANAPKIVDRLLSILAEKDIKKTEACFFPLLYMLIESKLLNVEYLKLLLNNLLITSDKCT